MDRPRCYRDICDGGTGRSILCSPDPRRIYGVWTRAVIGTFAGGQCPICAKPSRSLGQKASDAGGTTRGNTSDLVGLHPASQQASKRREGEEDGRVHNSATKVLMWLRVTMSRVLAFQEVSGLLHIAGLHGPSRCACTECECKVCNVMIRLYNIKGAL